MARADHPSERRELPPGTLYMPPPFQLTSRTTCPCCRWDGPAFVWPPGAYATISAGDREAHMPLAAPRVICPSCGEQLAPSAAR